MPKRAKRRTYTRTVRFHPMSLLHSYIGTVGNIGGKPYALIRCDSMPEGKDGTHVTSYRVKMVFKQTAHRCRLRHVTNGFRALLGMGRPA